MKKNSKYLLLVLIPVFTGSLVLTGCGKSDPIAQYYSDAVNIAKIQDILKNSAEKFGEANVVYQDAVKTGKKPDAAALAEKCNAAVKILEDGKKAVESLKTGNADAKKYNDALLSAINNQIGGYSDMLKGMTETDEAMINRGGKKIEQSGKDIEIWMAGSPVK